MSKSEERASESGYRKRIRQAAEEAHDARRLVRREQPNPSGEALKLLVANLADFRDILWNYRNERALDTAWDERPVNVDCLDELLNSTVKTTKTLPRRGSPRKTVEVQAARMADPQALFRIGNELDDIAKELGFAAEAKVSRNMYHIADPDTDHPEPVSDNVKKPNSE